MADEIVAARGIVLARDGDDRVAQMNELATDIRFEGVDPRDGADELRALCAGAVVLVAPNTPATNDIAAGIKGLKLVQTLSAGTDNLDKARLVNLGIRVANNGGANATNVAEHAIGLLLMVTHKLYRQAASAHAGRWTADMAGLTRTDFQTLTGKRLGIIGLGRIGTSVARRLVNWGAEIVYHDVAEFSPDYERTAGARRVPLAELYATSDIVTLHVPLDRNTRAMVSDAEFRAMKPTAVLLNTCRGPVVDEAALIRALEGGEIYGAGLDVTEVEPLDPASPLLTLPNVVVTPHGAGRAEESAVNATRNAVANADRVARGEEPLWVVEPV